MPFDGGIQQVVLDRFYKSLLNNPKSWHGSKYGDTPRVRPKDDALRYRLIQHNGTKYVRYFAFDMDDKAKPASDRSKWTNEKPETLAERCGVKFISDRCLTAWQDANLPRP